MLLLVKHFFADCCCFLVASFTLHPIKFSRGKTRTVFDDRSILRPLSGLECEDKSRLMFGGLEGEDNVQADSRCSLVSRLETRLSNRSGVTGHWCHHRSLLDSADSNVDP